MDHLTCVEAQRAKLLTDHKAMPEKIVAQKRYEAAERIAGLAVRRDREAGRSMTDKIDAFVLHRFFGPLILLAVIFAFYELSIVQGYKITAYTWPALAAVRDLIASILPSPGFIFDPLLRTIPLGVVDGIAAVFNYIPIFLILFALIAIMEDSGYMARVAFLLDRLFRYFGLHGQSAMPMILSGVLVGGCAIPGVMACRTIKDEKARLATMLISPLMNCMAKIPLYVLLVGMFFPAHKGVAMFFISTITLIVALGVAKILSLTLLRKAETAPFVLELPFYHMPTLRGVIQRCLERTWLFAKKIVTIVMIVVLFIYLLLNFPGLSARRVVHYENELNRHVQAFYDAIGEDNPYAPLLKGPGLAAFAVYQDDYKKARMEAKGEKEKISLDDAFRKRNADFFKIASRGKYMVEGKPVKDAAALKASKEYKKLDSARSGIKADVKEETIIGSVMGRLGRALEPVTRYAGFNWRVNIALISAFAAKENSVATLGSIYQSREGEEEKALEERMKEKETDWTPLHALALIIFMTMYPPCIATLMMIKLESGSAKWALFATIYPIVLGSLAAALVFTGGSLLHLSGIEAMVVFYLSALAVAVFLGFIKNRDALEDYE